MGKIYGEKHVRKIVGNTQDDENGKIVQQLRQVFEDYLGILVDQDKYQLQFYLDLNGVWKEVLEQADHVDQVKEHMGR